MQHRKQKHRLSPDGLPVDAKEWTHADWQDLHNAMEKVKALISNRHKEKTDEPRTETNR